MHSRFDRHLTISHFELQQFVAGNTLVDLEGVNFRRGHPKVFQQPANHPFVNQRSGSLWISNALGYVRIAGRIANQ